jgi:hypothetical protein
MENDLITPGTGGVYVDIYVQPGAKHPGVMGRHGDALKIATAARAIEGEANKAAIRAVAEMFGVATDDVEIVAGEKSRNKRLFLRGVSLTVAHTRIDSLP